MLFEFFRRQLEPERPTISATVRRASETGEMDVGGNMRVEVFSDASCGSAVPAIIVMGRPGSAAAKA